MGSGRLHSQILFPIYIIEEDLASFCFELAEGAWEGEGGAVSAVQVGVEVYLFVE